MFLLTGPPPGAHEKKMSPTNNVPTSVQPISETRRSMLTAMGLVHETDIAAMLGVRVETLWTWRKANRGPSFSRLGRDIYYPVEKFREWVAANTRSIMSTTNGTNESDFSFDDDVTPAAIDSIAA
jgi:predicted DNA-binding transcriptional regulator AlpA